MQGKNMILSPLDPKDANGDDLKGDDKACRSAKQGPQKPACKMEDASTNVKLYSFLFTVTVTAGWARGDRRLKTTTQVAKVNVESGLYWRIVRYTGNQTLIRQTIRQGECKGVVGFNRQESEIRNQDITWRMLEHLMQRIKTNWHRRRETRWLNTLGEEF